MDKAYVFGDLCSALTFGRLGGLHAVPDRDQLSIDIFETGPEGIDNSLDLALHKDSRERPKGFVQEIVFRIPRSAPPPLPNPSFHTRASPPLPNVGEIGSEILECCIRRPSRMHLDSCLQMKWRTGTCHAFHCVGTTPAVKGRYWRTVPLISMADRPTKWRTFLKPFRGGIQRSKSAKPSASLSGFCLLCIWRSQSCPRKRCRKCRADGFKSVYWLHLSFIRLYVLSRIPTSQI